jgi:hypothetical protein
MLTGHSSHATLICMPCKARPANRVTPTRQNSIARRLRRPAAQVIQHVVIASSAESGAVFHVTGSPRPFTPDGVKTLSPGTCIMHMPYA